MSQHHRLIHGRARQRRNAVILAASDVCHICGHQGADEVDHVIPLASANGDKQQLARLEAPDNLRPAHGPAGCPTCGVKCNRVKSDKTFAPVVRRSGSLARPRAADRSNT